MRVGQGFTLLELAIALAVVGVLTTLSYMGYQGSLQKSNFRSMQEFGIDLALRQQMHRQRYGKYAETVASTGNSNINRLVMPSASQYNVNVLSATFHGYRVEVSQRPGETATMPEQCRVLVVESDMGIQRFGARSASNQNTSARCIPHG